MYLETYSYFEENKAIDLDLRDPMYEILIRGTPNHGTPSIRTLIEEKYGLLPYLIRIIPIFWAMQFLPDFQSRKIPGSRD